MLANLINGGFQGEIYPVNSEAQELMGRKAYRSVNEIPATPDLAVIAVPPSSVAQTIRECTAKGVRAGVIITAGFAELGEQGSRLQQEIVETARAGGMVLVGPNCNGIMSPWDNLYIEFPSFHVPPGPIAVVAQSGNVMDVLSRQVMVKGLGCSQCVASGNEADLHIEDYLAYLGDDPHTKVILCYIEGFKDGGRFFKIAAEVGRVKPIVMVKAGKTQAGARAAASHTASLAGSDIVFDGICRQAGIVRASGLDDMLNIGIAFLRQPLPKGRRLGIVTAGGGWGVLAADACSELGLDVVTLPEETIREMDAFLPAWWNRGNPVDLVASSFGEAVFKPVETVLACPSVDAVVFLSIMTALRIKRLASPQEEAASETWGDYLVKATLNVMERFNGLAERYGKPVIVASDHLIATSAQEARIIHELGRNHTMCYRMPQEAAAVMNALASYGEWLKKGSS